MKPRLYKSNGIWVCLSIKAGMRCKAAGLTPWSAYQNWREAYVG